MANVNLPRLRAVWAGVLAIANAGVAGSVTYAWGAGPPFYNQLVDFGLISIWIFVLSVLYFQITKQRIKSDTE